MPARHSPAEIKAQSANDDPPGQDGGRLGGAARCACVAELRQAYADAVTKVYGQLAREEKITRVPCFVCGVGVTPSLMQADGIHPTNRRRCRCSMWCGRISSQNCAAGEETMSSATCPCGSGARSKRAADGFTAGNPPGRRSPDALALHAYVLGLEDYLKVTWHPDTGPRRWILMLHRVRNGWAWCQVAQAAG